MTRRRATLNNISLNIFYHLSCPVQYVLLFDGPPKGNIRSLSILLLAKMPDKSVKAVGGPEGRHSASLCELAQHLWNCQVKSSKENARKIGYRYRKLLCKHWLMPHTGKARIFIAI